MTPNPSLTDEVRRQVMLEIMLELRQYGHANAAQHVANCMKRMEERCTT